MIIKQLTGPGKNSDLSNCVAYSDHAIFFLMYLAYAVFFLLQESIHQIVGSDFLF